MDWYRMADLLDEDTGYFKYTPDVLQLVREALRVLLPGGFNRDDMVAWDNKPFLEEYKDLWVSRGLIITGPGCLYVKYFSNGQVYTYPLRVKVDLARDTYRRWQEELSGPQS